MVARLVVLNVTTVLGTTAPAASNIVAFTVADVPAETEVTVASETGSVSAMAKVGTAVVVVVVLPPEVVVVVVVAPPLPQPARMASIAANKNQTEKFENFWFR